MKYTILTIAICIQTFAFGQEKKLTIQFSKNVELVGYIIHLGDPADINPEHFISQVLNKWEADKTNPTLFKIFEVGADMGYSGLIELFYTLPEFPLAENFKIQDVLIKIYPHKSTSELKKLEELVSLANQFTKESAFNELWSSLEPYRTEILKVLNKNKPSEQLLLKMEQVYEKEFSSYQIVPSLTIWPTAGWGLENVRKQEAIFVLGPQTKNFDFSDKDKFDNLAIHEFGHAFVNEVVLDNKDLINKTQDLFPPLKDSMYIQGYHTWESCVIEHFVRAGEIFIPEVMGDTTRSESLMKVYVEEKEFVYLPFVVKQLKSYRIDQDLSYQEAVRQTLADLQNEYR